MDAHQNTGDQLRISYNGDGGTLFGLAFKTGLLTVVTLGIYRFWQKTRIRKYIWSSAEADGDTFEYTGTGLEKLLGFLVAIVFLAVYLGVIQMVLFYFGLSLMEQPDPYDMAGQLRVMAAFYISFFAVLPFLLFAAYRARRYKMARTRWRGIRFGMDKGAWGYVARAIGYGLLSIVTLGALLPLATFKLEKYMTDRSHFGDARFEQHGKWTALYPAMKHIGIGALILIVGIVGAVTEIVFFAFVGFPVGYIWLMVGFVYFSVHSFAYLTRNKTLGGEITFDAQPRTGEVIKYYILGGLAIGLVAGIAFAILAAVMGGMVGLMMAPTMGAMIITGLGIFAGYVLILVLIDAMGLALITQPIIAHFIDAITIGNAGAITRIQQREAETGVDAEGFADALDIGGAI